MTGIFTFHTHIVALYLVAISFGILQLDALKNIFTNTSIDIEKLKERGATVLSKKTAESPECSWVMEEEVNWEVFNQEDSTNYHITTKNIIDDYITTITMTNAQETWITSSVKIRPYYNCFYQSDEKLVEMVQKSDYNLVKPSSADYNFSSPYLSAGQWGQARFLDLVVFKESLEDGFFVEAGADDFVSDSNTLYFETRKNWTGLLIEPNPIIYPKGLVTNRRAWFSPNCLSTSPAPHLVSFSNRAVVAGGMAGIVPDLEEGSYVLQCLPLYTLMAACQAKTVNYLSLDIEGVELQVLKTIPWEKVDIEVLTVEVTHAGEIAEGSEKDIKDFLEEQGYIYFHTLGHDEVYIRKDLYHGKYNPDLEKLEQFYKDIQHTCRVYSRQENFLNLFNDERRDEGNGPQCIKPIVVNET